MAMDTQTRRVCGSSNDKNDWRNSGGTLQSWLNLISQHQSTSVSISQHQSASVVSINQHVNQHQSKFVIDLATICTGINAPNFWGAWGGYGEILRSVRRLCEKVARGRLQEFLSELTTTSRLREQEELTDSEKSYFFGCLFVGCQSSWYECQCENIQTFDRCNIALISIGWILHYCTLSGIWSKEWKVPSQQVHRGIWVRWNM